MSNVNWLSFGMNAIMPDAAGPGPTLAILGFLSHVPLFGIQAASPMCLMRGLISHLVFFNSDTVIGSLTQ
jgi:hypothetical protein